MLERGRGFPVGLGCEERIHSRLTKEGGVNTREQTLL